MNTFLFISNDKWFDFVSLMNDTKGFLYWYPIPKKAKPYDRVYMYLSGGTKAVKYEFEIVDINLPSSQCNVEYNDYLLDKTKADYSLKGNESLLSMKLVREIKDLEATSPKNLKEKGKILGMLMSHRTLYPFSIDYLDSIK